MNIGINLLFLEPGRVGGSETFARELLKRIDKDLAQKNKVILYCTNSFASTVRYKNILTYPCINNAKNHFKRFVFEIFILPLLLVKDKIQLLHSMGYTSPLVTHCKKIVTIFDTQFKAVPYTVSTTTRFIYSLLMPLVVKFNSLVITSSKFSKKEIVRYLGGFSRKIKVIYGAAEDQKGQPLTKSQRGNYIMTASATHHHKNVVNLIEAFNLLKQEDRHKNLKLYITGFASSGHKAMIDKIESLVLTKKVKFLGWLNRPEYLNLVRKSKVFVFPSLYEGFGLPPLEAMALGTPVVVSDKASLPEVVGDAGLIIKPKDSKNIARKINDVLTNAKLFSKLVEKGEQRAQMFSWDKSYKDLLKIYKML